MSEGRAEGQPKVFPWDGPNPAPAVVLHPPGAGRIRRHSPDVGKRPLEKMWPREKTKHEFFPPNFPLSFLKVNPELQQLQWLGKSFPWRAGRMFWGGT